MTGRPRKGASHRRVVVAASGEAWPKAFKSKRVLKRSCHRKLRRRLENDVQTPNHLEFKLEISEIRIRI
jgi:hypothetical protein